MNHFKTLMLLVVMSGIFFLVGDLIGGPGNKEFAYIALGISLLMNFITYWFSDKIVLRMYRAQPIGAGDSSGLYEMVEKLARSQRMPMPKVYIIPDDSPNAFATGRNPNNAAVAATRGIMRLLSREELEGVMAHELAHVKNRDILISTIAATFAAAINFMARMFMFSGGGRNNNRDARAQLIGFLVAFILAPLAAMVVQSLISKGREYAADKTGAEICRNPNALASALSRLESGVAANPMDCDPATAHMFIVSAFGRRRRGGGMGSVFGALFSTHPPIPERVARLRAMRV